MASAGENSALSELHKRHVLIRLQHADEQLSQIEQILNAAASRSPFPKYTVDVTSAQSRVVLDYIARIRAQMLRAVEALGIAAPAPRFGANHSMRVTLSFLRVSLEEIAPQYLRGYGAVPEPFLPVLDGLSTELEGLVMQLDAFLGRDPAEGLQQRLERLNEPGDDAELAKTLDRVIGNHGLVEFRAALSMLVDRLASSRFEIALFGQVSCGKSSLLNDILGADVLPVGVRPMTAVPTRLLHGRPPALTVSFADRRTIQVEVERLAEFVTEDANPGNAKAVTSVVVGYPSERLGDGIVFVDTPGLGSLATSGAAQTRAYLPQCDLGVVLVNAGATLTEVDLQTLRALYEAGIPALIVLSKADLVTPEDRPGAVEYVRQQVRSHLGIDLAVTPVSTRGQDEKLLQQWFDERIAPLYREHRRLASESVRRKLGALRESVAAALRSKLAPAASNSATPAGKLHEGESGVRGAGQPLCDAEQRLREAEQRLRLAAGLIPQTEKACLDATDAIREGAPVALASAAARLVEHWRAGGDNSAAIAESALAAEALSRAEAVRDALLALAAEFAKALRAAAQALGAEDPPAAEELAAGLNGMPQIDLRIEELPLHSSWSRMLGARFEAGQVEAQLEKIAGRRVEQAFVSYGRVLQAWLRRALGELRHRFDGYADGYRAQLERSLGVTETGPEERRQVESDLRMLLGSAAAAVPEPARSGVDHAANDGSRSG